MPRLRTWLLLPLCLSTLGSCDDDGAPLDLAEFRSEIGEVGLSRVVIARMYQRGDWMVQAVDAKAPAAEKIAHVCAALKPLLPTYVSGLVRLDADDVDHDITDEMLEVYAGVKACVREHVHAKTGRKVRFDVVLNALHYTATKEGVTSMAVARKRLKQRLATANELKPDGYFFDFFSEPWIKHDQVYQRDALAEGIVDIQKQERFVGGNIGGGKVPPGADFVAFTDRGGHPNVKKMMNLLPGADKRPPVLLHVRNDPHCVDSEGRRYVSKDIGFRKHKILQHLKWSEEFGLTYMYPVLFPLYAPGVKQDDCDHGKMDPGSPGHDGFVFDASQDGDLLDTMRKHLGPAPKQGEPVQKQLLSETDAMPTPYDPDDVGLVAVHRADDAVLGHVYSADLYELEIVAGLALTAEDYFALAPFQGPGTLPLRRCDLGDGHHLLTTDPACEGVGVDEGVLGFIGAAPIDGTAPLHRLSRAPFDHLFTTSAAERDAALTLGFTYEGVVGHVWDELGFAAPELPAPPAPPPDPALPCADPRIPVYRGYHTKRKQHLFAVNHDELLVPSMTDEGVPFQLKPGAAPDGWAALHRCLLPNSWHLLTTDPACEGAANAIDEGVLGNLARTELPGTVPLRRYFHAAPDGKNDHLFVVGADCVDIVGYSCEGIVGYVCPP